MTCRLRSERSRLRLLKARASNGIRAEKRAAAVFVFFQILLTQDLFLPRHESLTRLILLLKIIVCLFVEVFAGEILNIMVSLFC